MIIIFDIGGVLIRFHDNEIIKHIAKKTEANLQTVKSLFDFKKVYRLETGRLTGRRFYELYVRGLLEPLTYSGWVGLWKDYYEINRPGYDLFNEVKAAGYKVCFLSNLGDFHQEALELKHPGFFKQTYYNFFSYELGFHKPEPEIYRKVITILKVPPDQCFFIDDNPANTDGAVKAGMRSRVFTNETVPHIRHEIFKSADAG